MAGHKINNQDRTYWQANPDDLKAHYMKVLPYLSIDEAKVKDVESTEFKAIMADSVKKDKKIAEMQKKMELMDDMLKSMMENQLSNDIKE